MTQEPSQEAQGRQKSPINNLVGIVDQKIQTSDVAFEQLDIQNVDKKIILIHPMLIYFKKIVQIPLLTKRIPDFANRIQLLEISH